MVQRAEHTAGAVPQTKLHGVLWRPLCTAGSGWLYSQCRMATMSELERALTGDATTGAEAQPSAEPERTTGFVSGPQPLRPPVPSHAIPRPAPAPIRRPEPAPKPRFGRTMTALKTVLPILQRALPLLEGNVASAVANLLAPMPLSSRVDLEPVERAIRSMHTDLEQLRDSHGEQTAALKRVDEQLAELKDAAERTADRQRELGDELHSLRRRVVVFAVLGLALLLASVGASVFLIVKTGALGR